MSTPFNFVGPVGLPADPTTNLGPATKQYADAKISNAYWPPLTSPGDITEYVRLGSVMSTIPFWIATSTTSTSARTFTAQFPIGFDPITPARTITGFQMWVATAPTLATQTGAWAVYTSATASNTAQTRVGSNGTISLATGATGNKQTAFASPIAITGQSVFWLSVQVVLTTPGTGVGAAFAACPQSNSSITNVGGKYGEFTTATTTPGATIDTSAPSSSITLGQLAWIALY
jgi:hypothetical protein